MAASVGVSRVTGPGGVVVAAPVLVLAPDGALGDGPRRWIDGAQAAWSADGGRSVRVAQGPSEMRDSPARKEMLCEVLSDSVDGALRAGPDDRLLLVVEMAGVYAHSGADADLTREMTTLLRDAVVASRKPGVRLSLVLVAESLPDVPDVLPSFETILTGLPPTPEVSARGNRALGKKPRPVEEPPPGYVWAGQMEWDVAPTR